MIVRNVSRLQPSELHVAHVQILCRYLELAVVYAQYHTTLHLEGPCCRVRLGRSS